MDIKMNGELSSMFYQLLSNFVMTLPKIFLAILILFIGVFIAKWVAKLIQKLLSKMGIDTLTQKIMDIDIVEKANLNINISLIVAKIFQYFIVLLSIVIATEVIDLAMLSSLVVDIIDYIPNILATMVVLIFGLLFADIIRNIVHTACSSLGIPSSKLISGFVFYFLLINVIVTAISQAKINTAFLSQNLTIIMGGIVLAFAIGYGLASKDIVANFLASFYSKEKFSIGDIISIDDEKGQIIYLDNSTVTISSSDRQIVYPLSYLTNHKVVIHNS